MLWTAAGRLAFLSSPSQGVWHVGPLPVRAYALCILLGIVEVVPVFVELEVAVPRLMPASR